ncbi:MAG: aminotransferase class V-fold PLP-dependent enzyme, partial [Christensenellales bacterium]
MIFLDNASTTKPDDEIVNNFVKYQQYFFNPGANYSPSLFLNEKIESAREEIVNLLGGSKTGTFIFTGSSTEANNIILNSVVSNNKNEEYVFSSLEHPSIYALANKLLLGGRKVKFVPSTRDGFVDEKALLNSINENTKFVSVINVSNETGAVNSVNELAKKIKQINPKTLVHSDGVQALGKIKVEVDNLDFYTISSHKIYGLKGIAGFYCKNLKSLRPFVLGGGQEFDIRSGTTNA